MTRRTSTFLDWFLVIALAGGAACIILIKPWRHWTGRAPAPPVMTSDAAPSPSPDWAAAAPREMEVDRASARAPVRHALDEMEEDDWTSPVLLALADAPVSNTLSLAPSPEPGAISGIVENADAQPIGGALVALISEEEIEEDAKTPQAESGREEGGGAASAKRTKGEGKKGKNESDRTDARDGKDAKAAPAKAANSQSKAEAAQPKDAAAAAKIASAARNTAAAVSAPAPAARRDFSDYTKIDGSFILRGVPPGSWTLVASHDADAAAHHACVAVLPGRETTGIRMILTPGIQIRGIVKDASGTGLSGARIEVRRNFILLTARQGGARSADYFYRDALSGPGGAFTLEHIAPGENTLDTALQGFGPDQRTIEASPRAESRALEIVLRPAAAIGGRAEGPMRRPLEGARVKAWSMESRASAARAPASSKPAPALAETATDAGGEFLLRELRNDKTYDIQVESPGLAVGWLLDVRPNTFQNSIILEAGGAIAGRVTSFGTSNPVANMVIAAHPLDGPGFWKQAAETSAEGTYQIPNLAAGAYEVYISSSRWVSEPRRPVAVKSDAVTGGQNFSIYQGIRLTGTIVDARSGARIPGAEAIAEGWADGDLRTARRARVFASDSGEFIFPGLPEGAYCLTASASGYETPSEEYRKTRVELSAGAAAAPVEIALRPGGRVIGKVEGLAPALLSRTQAAVHQYPGAVPQISVRGARSGRASDAFFIAPTVNAASRAYRASCDSEGEFEINGIPLDQAVSFYILASADGQAIGQSDVIMLNSQRPCANVRIVMTPGQDLEGVVLDSQQDPIEGAEVTFEPEAWSESLLKASAWTIQTDAPGGFFLEHLPAGIGEIRVFAAGFQPFRQKISLEAGEVHEPIVVNLSAGGVVAGLIVDDLGNPLEGSWVTCSNTTKGRNYLIAQAEAGGQYVLKGAAAGANAIRARHERKTPQGTLCYDLKREGVKPDTDSCDFVFPINARLTALVLAKETNRPIESFRVEVKIAIEEGMGATGTFRIAQSIRDKSGALDLQNLPGGKGKIVIRADGYLPWESKQLEFQSPETLDLNQVTLPSAGEALLRVASARTGDPISGAKATWLPSGPDARSDVNGLVKVKNIPRGVGRLRVEHAHYLSAESGPVQVIPGKSPREQRVELEPGALLTGTVTGAQGAPLAGTVLTVIDSKGAARSARTDSGGNYLMDGLLPGGASIRAEKTLRQTVAQTFRETLLYADDETIEDIELVAGSAVRGSVVSPGGVWIDPGAGAVQALLMASEDKIAGLGAIAGTVDSDGDYAIEDLVPGLYLILGDWPVLGTARRDDANPVPSRLKMWAVADLRQGPVTRCDLALPLSSVSGFAFAGPPAGEGQSGQSGDGEAGQSGAGGAPAPSCAPLANFPVVLTLANSPLTGAAKYKPWWQWSARTNAQGRYAFGGLGPGLYRLSSTAKTPAKQAMAPVTLQIGSESEEATANLYPATPPTRQVQMAQGGK